jgi:uncharacterized membrane protein YfcA
MHFYTALALLLSGMIGVSLGLMGGGGSILALPVLVYVAGVDPRQAVAMSLAIVGSTSLMAGLMHHRGGRVDRRVGIVFGAAGLPAAFIGARLTHLVPAHVLLLLFGVLMLVVGGVMLSRSRREPGGESPQPVKRPRLGAIVAAGFGVGFLTGFLGVGGGFIIVPSLVLFAGLAMPTAVGTSLLVIALNCAAGLLGHLGEGGVPLRATATFTGVAIVGGFVGERLSSRLSPRSLRRGFAVFVLLLATYILIRNLAALV